jgi:subtilisin family serine protease
LQYPRRSRIDWKTMAKVKKRTMGNILKVFLASVIALGANLMPAFAQQNEGFQVANGQLIVSVAIGTTRDSVDAVAARYGCEVLRPVAYTPGFYVLGLKSRNAAQAWSSLTPEIQTAIDQLAKDSAITSVGPNAKIVALADTITPNDPLQDRTWGLNMIHMPQAWAIQSGDPVRVADLDTGVDSTHEDFKTSSGVSVLVDAADFTNDGAGPNVDPNGHGSHTSGTIGAVTNNGKGVPSVAGLQQGGILTSIIPVRVLGADGSGQLDWIVSGINYAVQHQAKVINMSLGVGPTTLGPGSFAAMQKACDDAVAAGVVVVCSAGNSSTNSETGQFSYPADFPGVIKVSAVGPKGDIASYSSYGRLPNPQLIAAPGGDFAVTTDSNPGIWSVKSGGGYVSEQGTSMAAPHVSGLVALMIAAGVKPTDVYPMLARNAQKPTSYDPVKFGAGIIDAYKTMLEAANPIPGATLVGGSTLAASAAATDRGTSYFSPTSIKVVIAGAINIVDNSVTPTDKQVRQSAITVEVYRLGESMPFRTFVGGADFLVPKPAATDLKSVKFTVDVPSVGANRTARPADTGVKLPDTSLTPGQSYKIVAKVSGAVQSTQFITIEEKLLTPGRSMFALPFRAGLATGTGPVETQLLGSAVAFTLTRYNPLRLPSEDDYARYQSTGSVADSAARFLVSGTASGPATFDIASPSTSLAPIGVGYWLDLGAATKIDTARLTDGRSTSIGLDATNAVGIRVTASGGGWNMIGAPFTYPVEWSAVSVQSGGVNYALPDAIANGIISPVLVGYDVQRRDYSYSIAPGGTLQPFNAYWVRAFRDAVLIVPPRDSGATRSLKVASKPELGTSWMVQFSAAVAGDRDSQNFIGQAPSAQDGADKIDIPKPPAGAGHAYVRFEAKDAVSTRALAYDLRSARSAQKQEWTAAVTSDRANADVTLSWGGLQSVPKRSKLMLKDLVTDQTISMQSRASYTYRSGEAGETRRFALVLEPQATAGGLLISNVRTSGGTRAEGGMTVKFLVNQDAEINGAVRSLSGKTIATLAGVTRAQAGGDATLRWNGKAQDGSAIPAGPYVLEVVARATDGSVVRVARTIQHLR